MTSIIKKEILEGIRSYKLLIIAVGVIFFAFLDPLILKLLPKIMEYQMPGFDLASIMRIDQPTAVMNYYKNLHQIGTLIIGFTLMSLIAGELKNKTTIIPWCSGMNFTKWIVSKFIVYFLFLLVIMTTSTVINYYYSCSLFSGHRISLLASIKGGFMFSMFYTFLVSCLIFFGSLLKKPNIAALISITLAYLISPISGLFKVSQYTPAGLLTEANLLTPYFTKNGLVSIIATLGLILIMLTQSVFRMKNVDLS
jgi:ABC-2 type transport system permease protein